MSLRFTRVKSSNSNKCTKTPLLASPRDMNTSHNGQDVFIHLPILELSREKSKTAG
jgi:hypothetical protein